MTKFRCRFCLHCCCVAGVDKSNTRNCSFQSVIILTYNINYTGQFSIYFLNLCSYRDNIQKLDCLIISSAIQFRFGDFVASVMRRTELAWQSVFPVSPLFWLSLQSFVHYSIALLHYVFMRINFNIAWFPSVVLAYNSEKLALFVEENYRKKRQPKRDLSTQIATRLW